MHPCKVETLARGRLVGVQRCADCDHLTIHVGPISFRVEVSVARELWTTLGSALNKLETRSTALAPAQPRGLA